MTRRSLVFAACIVALTAGALAIRLPNLAARPMHCDEANQAKKTGDLLEAGEYRYDPTAHHGPTLYWLTLPTLWLGGVQDFASSTEVHYRLVPVAFGVGLVLLLLLLGDAIGRGPAVIAGVLTAISPAMVFYSRYYIQEMLLVFFTLAGIASAWRYCRSKSLGWAAATGASLGLMYATKETWVLSGAAMAVGLALAMAWTGWREGPLPPLGRYFRPAAVVAAVAAGLVVAILFYSSFGRNWSGPLDSFKAYAVWTRRGGEGELHNQPWWYYLQILVASRPGKWFLGTELFIVVLAAIGALFQICVSWKKADNQVPLSLPEKVGGRGGCEGSSTPSLPTGAYQETAAVNEPSTGQSAQAHPHPGRLSRGEGDLQARHFFLRFLTVYTLTLLVLYSAIPYKTPWCLLGFLEGMILLAGVGAWVILACMPRLPLKAAAAVLLVAGAYHLYTECAALNGPRLFAEQDRNPYVYAHTSTDVLKFAARMEQFAKVSPEGHNLLIQVVTPENIWPLPWYLREFNHVGCWSNADDWSNAAPQCPAASVIICTSETQDAVNAHLRGQYNKQILHRLRPEVFFSVYVREDLWQAYLGSRDAALPEKRSWLRVARVLLRFHP